MFSSGTLTDTSDDDGLPKLAPAQNHNARGMILAEDKPAIKHPDRNENNNTQTFTQFQSVMSFGNLYQSNHSDISEDEKEEAYQYRQKTNIPCNSVNVKHYTDTVSK